MGMDAELIAVGPFRRGIAGCLEYPADFYEGVPDGATVVCKVLVCSTTDQSEALARALGTEARDLGRHCWRRGELRYDPAALARIFPTDVHDGNDPTEVARLFAAGFSFFYMPNG